MINLWPKHPEYVRRRLETIGEVETVTLQIQHHTVLVLDHLCLQLHQKVEVGMLFLLTQLMRIPHDVHLGHSQAENTQIKLQGPFAGGYRLIQSIATCIFVIVIHICYRTK